MKLTITSSEVHTKDMMKCPRDVPAREWVYACERAARAKRYAEALPEHVKSCEAVFSEAGLDRCDRN